MYGLYFCKALKTWSIRTLSLNRLAACEIWLLRIVMRIKWTSGMANSKLLKMAGVDRQILHLVKPCWLGYLGHILHGERYAVNRVIVLGCIHGRRGPGDKQLSWFRNIHNCCGIYNAGMIYRKAVEGTLWTDQSPVCCCAYCKKEEAYSFLLLLGDNLSRFRICLRPWSSECNFDF